MSTCAGGGEPERWAIAGVVEAARAADSVAVVVCNEPAPAAPGYVGEAEEGVVVAGTEGLREACKDERDIDGDGMHGCFGW